MYPIQTKNIFSNNSNIPYIGPSFPTANPPATANITPNTFAINAFKRSTCGIATPLR
jgi:hypothetical protein